MIDKLFHIYSEITFNTIIIYKTIHYFSEVCYRFLLPDLKTTELM